MLEPEVGAELASPTPPNSLSPFKNEDSQGAGVSKVLSWVLQSTLYITNSITINLIFLLGVDKYRYLN